MFSNKPAEDNQSRFDAASEFHKVAAKIAELEKKRDKLKSDFEKDSVSPGALKYHVLFRLLGDIHQAIDNFNQVTTYASSDDEMSAKIQLSKVLMRLVRKTCHDSRSILEMRRFRSDVYESTARVAVNAGAVAAWFMAPVSFFGGGLIAAAATKYLGDNVVANYEDYPSRNTVTQNILADLEKELTATITAMRVALGEETEVDATLFNAAPPR